METLEELQRRVESRKVRDRNLEARRKKGPQPGTRGRRPNQEVMYHSIFQPLTTKYIITADSKPITFFGGIAALGLAEPDNTGGYAPRGFRPAQIQAVRGAAAPRTVDNQLAGGKRQEYRAESNGDNQATFTAPLSADTSIELKNKFIALAKSKASDVGEYGRIDFINEKASFGFTG